MLIFQNIYSAETYSIKGMISKVIVPKDYASWELHKLRMLS